MNVRTVGFAAATITVPVAEPRKPSILSTAKSPMSSLARPPPLLPRLRVRPPQHPPLQPYPTRQTVQPTHTPLNPMTVVEERTLGLLLAALSAVSLLWHSLVLRFGSSKGGENSQGQRTNTDSHPTMPRIRIIQCRNLLLRHGIAFNRAFMKYTEVLTGTIRLNLTARRNMR